MNRIHLPKLIMVLALGGLSFGTAISMQGLLDSNKFPSAKRNDFRAAMKAISTDDYRTASNIERRYNDFYRAVDSGNNTLLLKASNRPITGSSVEFISSQIDKGAQVATANRFGSTSLDYLMNRIISSIKTSPEYINIFLLLEKIPALVTKRDQYGRTLLNVAAQYGRKEIVTTLIEKGADVNSHDKNMITPLRQAISGKHREIIDSLQAKGAIVYGNAVIKFNPSREFRRDLAQTMRDRYFAGDDTVDLVTEDKLHGSLYYMAIPLEYDKNEGESYLGAARTKLDEFFASAILAEYIGDPAKFFKPEPYIKPLGSFWVITYDTPSAYIDYVEGIEVHSSNQVPGGIKRYEEWQPFHISVAKVRGERLDPDDPRNRKQLDEAFRRNFQISARLFEPDVIGRSLSSSIRIPSLNEQGFIELTQDVR